MQYARGSEYPTKIKKAVRLTVLAGGKFCFILDGLYSNAA
jgi:hypothetical protein